MTTVAEFYSDPEALEEMGILYAVNVVDRVVPVVMAMLEVRETEASTDEKLRIFHDDLRFAVSAVLRWMGDPVNLDRCLNRMMCDGIDQSRKIFPAVDAFLRGEFDQFFQKISAGFQIPETG